MTLRSSHSPAKASLASEHYGTCWALLPARGSPGFCALCHAGVRSWEVLEALPSSAAAPSSRQPRGKHGTASMNCSGCYPAPYPQPAAAPAPLSAVSDPFLRVQPGAFPNDAPGCLCLPPLRCAKCSSRACGEMTCCENNCCVFSTLYCVAYSHK